MISWNYGCSQTNVSKANQGKFRSFANFSILEILYEVIPGSMQTVNDCY